MAELPDQSGEFPLILHEERFEDIETAKALVGLSGHYPVNIGIVVHANADRGVWIDITVSPGVEGRWLVVVAESVKVLEIAVVVLVILFHGRVKAIASDADFLAHDRGLERERREVTFHVAEILFTKQLDIFHGGIFTVICSRGPEFVYIGIEAAQMVAEIGRRLDTVFAHLEDFLLDAPNFIDSGLDSLDDIDIHLLLALEEPRTFLTLRHVGEYERGVVIRVPAEMCLDAAIRRESLLIELYRVDELGLVDEDPGQRERVGRTGAVLRENDGDRPDRKSVV